MDCSPLNLAHFHERRSERFLRNHRYDDAIKALETSLIYLQDVYKNVEIPKSIEVLDTQRWEFTRKLRQIEMRKMQHGQNKMKEFAPLKENSPMLPLRQDNSGSAQSVAKAIDKTVQEFDAKFIINLDKNDETSNRVILGRRDSMATNAAVVNQNENSNQTTAMTKSDTQVTQTAVDTTETNEDDEYEISLAPLELPSFDFNMFTSTSAPSLASFVGLTDNLTK